MKKGVSVNLPNQVDMKGGRVVEHHQSVGSEVQQGAIVLTVQIHDRTLQFKSPALGILNSMAPLGALPEPGDLLFRLLVEDKPEPKREPEPEFKSKPKSKPTNDKGAFNAASASDTTAEKATKSHQGTSPASTSGSLWSKAMASLRTGLGALLWVLSGSVLAGAFILFSGGHSPIGGWVPESRITLFDGAIDTASELHMAWIKRQHMATHEENNQKAVEKALEKKAKADQSATDQNPSSTEQSRENKVSQGTAQQSSGQAYQENVRRCSIRDKSCDPDVHVLCQLKQGRHSGEERWRNPIKSYMCAPQPVSYSNGMWRQGYADGTKACRDYFGNNAFIQSSFSRNSGFISSAEHKSDNPAQACLAACGSEASKFKKQCTGLPQKG